jgi:hypothetical protein
MRPNRRTGEWCVSTSSRPRNTPRVQVASNHVAGDVSAVAKLILDAGGALLFAGIARVGNCAGPREQCRGAHVTSLVLRTPDARPWGGSVTCPKD